MHAFDRLLAVHEVSGRTYCDEAIRPAIINGARERPGDTGAIYPLMLDLQVEHWRVLAAKREATPDRFTITADTFEARRNELVKRVLRDYGNSLRTTLERLSVARRFDRAAFSDVVRTSARLSRSTVSTASLASPSLRKPMTVS